MNPSECISLIEKNLAVQWPIYALVAINPLSDLTDLAFESACANLAEHMPVMGVMNIAYYHRLFALKKISVSSLKQVAGDQFDGLAELLTNANFQSDLELFEETRKYQAKNKSRILLSEQMKSHLKFDLTNEIKKKIFKWLMAYFDQGQASWQFPHKSENFYLSWKNLAAKENYALKTLLLQMPDQPDDALDYLLKQIKLPQPVQFYYFHQIICQLYGWSSFIKWLQSRPDNPLVKQKAEIKSLIIIWLCYEIVNLQRYSNLFKNEFKFEVENEVEPTLSDFRTYLNNQRKQLEYDIGEKFYDLKLKHFYFLWQQALELNYQNEILTKLSQPKINKQQALAKAQAIFCIDTRSEGFRRHLENSGPYQTFGFAGFFGFAFKLESNINEKVCLQCPALLAPEELVNLTEFYSGFKYRQHVLIQLLMTAKNHLLTPFILFEMLGFWFALKLLGKNYFPAKYKKYFENIDPAKFSYEVFSKAGFDLTLAINQAALFLKCLGLTKNFADTVLISAHRAQSDNNPYQAALDCGACGGNAGIANAIVAATVLNDERVRKGLREQQIHIPATTQFIPVCHNTTLDEIEFLMPHEKLDLSALKADLKLAGSRNREERLKRLPNPYSAAKRATLWSELLPEMGLANNALFIIGPRYFSQPLNLEGRAFLHDYYPEHDADGKILELLLSAPMVVAHWINSQYYFSVTDPHIFGSGNKAIHNLVGKLGVMLGNLSDLQIGLPQQSVFYQDEILHQPLRLFVLVYAKKSQVENILASNPGVNNLIKNRWIYFQVIEPDES